MFVPERSAGRTSGYLVRLAQQETSPARALTATVLIWVLGGVLLIWTLRNVRAVPLGLRTAAIGLLYTLIFIRGTLAFRVWLERPFRPRSSPCTTPGRSAARRVAKGGSVSRPTSVLSRSRWSSG